MNKLMTCCICLNFFHDEEGIGNNPRPVKADGVCCSECNTTVVMPRRLEVMATGEDNPLWQPIQLDKHKGEEVKLH